jgi:hypothetical protein
VSEDTKTSYQTPTVWRRLQTTRAEQPTITAIVAYTAVGLAAILAGYFAMFAVFQPYDDEGTLLVTLKSFVHGVPLYKEIWSVYGPFYYELFGGFFKVTGLAVTNDSGRTIVLVVWVATSTLFGVAAQRLTGRLSIGLTTMIIAFGGLEVLINEPMHPQGLAVLVIAGFGLAAVSGLGGRPVRSGAICGVLLAALMLTKVNLGIFAVAGVAVAAALTIEPIYRRRWLRYILVVAFLVMPLAIVERDLKLSWVRELLLLEVFSSLAVLIAGRTLAPMRGESDGGTLGWLRAAVIGFVVAFVAIIAIILLTGPSPSDVYEGVIKNALDIPDVLVAALPFPSGAALDWSIGAMVAATVASGVRLGRNATGPVVWTGLLRGAVGLVIFGVVGHVTPLALNPSSQNPVLIPMLLAWIVAIPPFGAVESPHKRFLRMLLPMVAIAETLQVYPAPGSQTGIGSAFFVLIAALCLADGLTETRAWSAARGGAVLRNFATTAGALVVAVPVMFGLNLIVLPGITIAQAQRELPKLELPGASLLRMGAPQVEEYRGLVDLLQENDCSTFVGWPSVNSLYLWSGLEIPRPTIPNGWFYAMTESQQQLAVEELRSSRRPCAIIDNELAASYLKGLPPPSTPLVHYVQQNFKPIKVIGPFEFELPKPSATDG